MGVAVVAGVVEVEVLEGVVDVEVLDDVVVETVDEAELEACVEDEVGRLSLIRVRGFGGTTESN